MPVPCATDDFINRWISELPTEFATNFFRARDQYGGFAGPPGRSLDENRVSGDLTGGFNHLPDAAISVVAQVPRL